MPHFYQVISPTLNGVAQPISQYNSYDYFQDWLSKNYPDFEIVACEEALARQSTYHDALPIIGWIPTEVGGYSLGVFHNMAGTPNNYDAEFKKYVDFYNSHPSWTTPGSVTEFVIENEEDIPTEWLDLKYYYWPGN